MHTTVIINHSKQRFINFQLIKVKVNSDVSFAEGCWYKPLRRILSESLCFVYAGGAHNCGKNALQ